MIDRLKIPLAPISDICQWQTTTSATLSKWSDWRARGKPVYINSIHI